MGSAPASSAVFRALAENAAARESPTILARPSAPVLAARARPATPEAGVLPNFGIRVKPELRNRGTTKDTKDTKIQASPGG